MAQPHMPTRSATVNDDAGGTVIIDTVDNTTNEKRRLVFKRALGGWILEIEHLGNISRRWDVRQRLPITYTQANVLGFMMRAARGDDE